MLLDGVTLLGLGSLPPLKLRIRPETWEFEDDPVRAGRKPAGKFHVTREYAIRTQHLPIEG